MYFIRDYDSPKLYQGSSNPDIMILGQDPTVSPNTRFDTVLGLATPKTGSDRESRNLQNYIFNRILQPLGIGRTRVVATNLVNVYYHDVPNSEIAKRYEDLIVSTAEKAGIDVRQYPSKVNGAILHALNFEARTRGDFEELLTRFPIRHLITLGEPVFQVLCERYVLGLGMKIRDVLEAISDRPREVVLRGKKVSLLPLPHIFSESNSKWRFYIDFLDKRLPYLAPWYNR